MVRAEQTHQISMDYVNVPDTSARRHPAPKYQASHSTGGKAIKVVAVSFGVLCVLQVALNVALRFSHFGKGNQLLNSQTKIQRAIEYLNKGWVLFGESVYFISTNKMIWQESRDFCLQRGADLVIINSRREQVFITQFYRLTWLGLFDTTKMGEWTWVDGTPLGKSYWGVGEPNGYMGRNESCVETRFFEVENSWNDIQCNEENFWICEKNL